MSQGDGAAEKQALQEALAAEHAAVYAYAVIGGVLDVDESPAIGTAYAAHRDRRDELVEMIGAGAVVAEPAYDLPFAVSGAKQARRLAVRVERRCADVYAAVVARTTSAHRMYAARALTDCAVRGLDWGADPDPFPGLANR